MITALNVANSVLDRAYLEREPISPMKLQKLVYFIYKRYYQETGGRLFSERFEAWPYGPVVPTIYNAFSRFRGDSIVGYYNDSSGQSWMIDPKSNIGFAEAFDYVWRKYHGETGITLSEYTHRMGTAWYKARQNDELCLHDEDIQAESWA